MRNLKILGLMLVAVGALAATTASADDFTSENKPTLLTGNQDQTHFFKTTAATGFCETIKYTGTLNKLETQEMTLEPVYEKCTWGGFPTEIDLNGCDYMFRIGAATTGTTDIVCPPEKEITVTVNPSAIRCIIHIKPQNGIGVVTYKNNNGAGPNREITAELKLGKIAYTHTAGTGIGKCTNGAGADGSIEGATLITGEEDPGGGSMSGIWVE